VEIREVHCKSVLNKSGIADWAVNCYAGCEHGCLYCYARFATRFSHPGERWGSFVDVKVNAPQVLAVEAGKKRIGRVFVSSVCDGWQPVEEKYGLTRQCLEILLRRGYPVTILTKSALAGRDVNLLVGKVGVELGVTLTSLDETMTRLTEPGSSSPAERLILLQQAKKRGVRTYAFLGPLLPDLSDKEEDLFQLVRAVKEAGVDFLYADRLNPRYGVWPALHSLLGEHFPHLTGRYRSILFDDRTRREYSRALRATLGRVSRRLGLEGRIECCF
jgi:DNA repair photolyase